MAIHVRGRPRKQKLVGGDYLNDHPPPTYRAVQHVNLWKAITLEIKMQLSISPCLLFNGNDTPRSAYRDPTASAKHPIFARTSTANPPGPARALFPLHVVFPGKRGATGGEAVLGWNTTVDIGERFCSAVAAENELCVVREASWQMMIMGTSK